MNRMLYGLLVACLLWPSAAMAQTRPRLVFGGNEAFPPYESVDSAGVPRGFNIELVKTLAAEAGMDVEFHLGPREDMTRALDEGRVDFMFLTLTEERDRKYAVLNQTWSMGQVLLMPSGRESYPAGSDDLAGLRVALEATNLNLTWLIALPAEKRPLIHEYPTRRQAIDAFQRGEVDGVIGNALTLAEMMGRAYADAVKTPLLSRPYHLVTRRGDEDAVVPLLVAFDAVRRDGRFDRLVETHLTRPEQVDWLTRNRTPLAAGALLVCTLLGIVIGWNRSLRAVVHRRTSELAESDGRFRDLAEVWRAERDFVSAVLDRAASLVMVLDREGRVVRFNRACEQLTGLAAGELLGKPVWELPFVDSADRERWRPRLARFTTSSGAVTIEREWKDRTGRRRLIQWTVAALSDDAGSAGHLIGVGTDVTDARELERLKTGFVSIASHELRTPLTSIKASLQLLVETAAEEDEATRQDLARVSLHNVDRLIRLVNDILDFSKIEAGQLRVRLLPCRVDALVEEAVQTVQHFAAGQGVALHADLGAHPPIVQADADRTVQALVNLLSNAVKHSPAGATVTIGSAMAAEHVSISVTDQGPGIAPHQVAALFEPFAELHRSGSKAIASTGLGLTITKALAELQGGTIAVDSQPGRGATFTLTLPVRSAAAA